MAVMNSPVVCLAGWGEGRECFLPVVRCLGIPADRVSLISLEDLGPDANAYAEHLRNRVPPGAVFCGWSTGAMLGLELCVKGSIDVRGIVSVSGCDSYLKLRPQARAARDLHSLRRRVIEDSAEAVHEFRKLVRGRSAVSTGRESIPSRSALLAGLDYLKQYDISDERALPGLAGSIVHGTEDRVVPIAAMQGVSRLLPDASRVTVQGAEHALLWTHAAEVAQEIAKYL